MVFLALWWKPGVYSRVMVGMAFKTHVCSATSGLLYSYEGHLRNLLEVSPGNTDASSVEAGDQVSLSSCNRDTGIPINFEEESSIVTF